MGAGESMDGSMQTPSRQDPENTIPGNVGHPEDRRTVRSTHDVPRTIMPSSHFVFPGLFQMLLLLILELQKLRPRERSIVLTEHSLVPVGTMN